MNQASSVLEETELKASNLDNHQVSAKRAQANKVHSSEITGLQMKRPIFVNDNSKH